MRLNYSEEENYPGQFELWQANCERSLKGRKGQTALRELETALLALSSKRLIAQELQNAEGDVCAIGALAKYRGREEKDFIADPEYEMQEVGVELGMPRLVAWKVVEVNDLEYAHLSPEARYMRVTEWIQRQLAKGD